MHRRCLIILTHVRIVFYLFTKLTSGDFNRRCTLWTRNPFEWKIRQCSKKCIKPAKQENTGISIWKSRIGLFQILGINAWNCTNWVRNLVHTIANLVILFSSATLVNWLHFLWASVTDFSFFMPHSSIQNYGNSSANHSKNILRLNL